MPDNLNPTRRDVVKAAGVVTATAAVAGLEGAPAILKVHAASDQMKYGMIGAGGRGSYLLKHLTKVENGRCAASSRSPRLEPVDRGDFSSRSPAGPKTPRRARGHTAGTASGAPPGLFKRCPA